MTSISKGSLRPVAVSSAGHNLAIDGIHRHLIPPALMAAAQTVVGTKPTVNCIWVGGI